jgi:ABC-type multidrug transport system fused ATPase/permease subunit
LHAKQVDQVLRIYDGTISAEESLENLQDAEEATAASLQSEHESIEHKPATTLPDEDDETRRAGDFTVYGHYLKTIGVWPVAVCLVASACHGFLLNFPKAWLTFWADDAARAHPNHSQAYYVGIYGLLEALLIGCFVIAGMTVLLVFIKESGAALHETALSTVINAPLRLFTKTDTGILTNYFAQDMTLIDGEMPLALVNLILDIFGVLGMAALLAASAPWLALAYPFMTAVLWVIQSFYLKTSRQIRLLDLEAKAPLYSHFIETLHGLATIRALGWEEDSKKHSRMLLNRSQQATYLLAVVQRWLFFVLNMVVAVVATILVSLITQLEGTSSSLSGASLVTLMSLSAALSDIVRFYALLETTIGAVARLRNFSSKTGSEQKAQQVFKPDPQWPSRGAIELEVDRASYSESGEDTALRHISLSIRPRQKVALCGRTGR